MGAFPPRYSCFSDVASAAPALADVSIVTLVGHDPVVLPLLYSLIQYAPGLLFDQRYSFLLLEAKRGAGSQLIWPYLFLHIS